MEKTHLIRCSKEEMEKTHLIRCLAINPHALYVTYRRKSGEAPSQIRSIQSKHLHRLRVYTQPTYTLCNLQEEMEKSHLSIIQEEMEKTHLIRCSPEEEMEKTHLIRCPALKTSTESQRYWYTGGNGEDPPDSVFKGGNGEDPPDSVSSGGNGDDPPDSVSSSKDNADPPDSVSSSKDKDAPDSMSSSKDNDGKSEKLGSKKTANVLLLINCYKCTPTIGGS
ncbi:unnamed protein product [Rodentolepis nana]|uniref:PCGF2 n=1 Tax=Rodentolepis nana TaxID=102285 RepID=A0A0R3TEP8_RODNA|nr:unnamed protein product [Rodentolepis nana]